MATATATLRSGSEQLYLCTDLAAAHAVAEAERQRAIDEASARFESPEPGFSARIAAAYERDERHGRFDRLRRLHDEIGGHDYVPRSAARQPITLVADLRCGRCDRDCCRVCDLVYRGRGPHYDREGPIRDRHSGAFEDAHDHAWPGWCKLPRVPRRPERGSSAKKASPAPWVKHVIAVYPDGWLEAGGPIRSASRRYRSRHVPAPHTGFGGYDLRGLVVAAGRPP